MNYSQFIISSALRYLSEELEARDWINRVLIQAGEETAKAEQLLRGIKKEKSKSLDAPSSFPISFLDLLEDGSILCGLINALNALSATNRFSPKLIAVDTSRQSYKRVENVVAFLEACKKNYRLKEQDLFEVSNSFILFFSYFLFLFSFHLFIYY